MERTPPGSILSHGEEEIARRLRAGDGPGEIAEARGNTEESVRRAIDRIEEKTDRALATLIRSPFTREAARDLDPELRRELTEALRAEGE